MDIADPELQIIFSVHSRFDIVCHLQENRSLRQYLLEKSSTRVVLRPILDWQAIWTWWLWHGYRGTLKTHHAYSVLFSLIQSYSALFSLIQSYSVLFGLIQSYSVLFSLIRSYSGLFSLIQSYFRSYFDLFPVVQCYLDSISLIQRHSALFSDIQNYSVELGFRTHLVGANPKRRNQMSSKSELHWMILNITEWCWMDLNMTDCIQMTLNDKEISQNETEYDWMRSE